MRNLIVLALIYLAGCSGFKYQDRVSSYSNESLCNRLGEYYFMVHEEGEQITLTEIQRRDLDAKTCGGIANAKLETLRKNNKIRTCEELAAFYSKGHYNGYKRTLAKIDRNGFAGDECVLIGELFLNRVKLKSERINSFSKTLNAIADRQKEDRLFSKGDIYNPIYIKIQ